MLSIIVLLLLVLCGTCASMLGGRVGGKKELPLPASAEVQAAAEFGANEKYHSLRPTINVLGGTQQVVAGMSYDLKVAVTRRISPASTDTECSVDKMVVGHQPWATPKYTLHAFERTDEACP